MEAKVISTQVIKSASQNVPAKILVGSARNFKRTSEPGDYYQRPLMVNAWSQTTNTDFRCLSELENREEQSKREKELLEKIRVLEENLKAHTELLSQIHATSARTSALLGQSQPEVKPIQIQRVESISTGYQDSLQTSTLSPVKGGSQYSANSTLISPLSSAVESVKYTIIAEGSDDIHGEPIEIQLAEDDEHLNLNSSVDSGRLEICLTSDDVEIKKESTTVTTDCENNSLSENSNYYLNDHVNENYHSYSPEKPMTTKRRSSNNLSGSAKRRAVNEDSPLQSLTYSHKTTSSGNADKIMVSIGPNNTRIPAEVYESINWSSASIATRKLLMTIFDRNTLATHSMTGKPSPAFKDHGKPLKQMLNPSAVQDIIFAVTRRCNVSEKEVRSAITTKCADENKMMKVQLNKRTPMREIKNAV